MRERRRGGERGAVLVESALSLLAFLAFIFGVIEAGRFMSVQGTLTNAAREGARIAVLPLRGSSTLPSSAAVQAAVVRCLEANAIRGSDAVVTVTSETQGTTTYTRVNVSLPYRVLTMSLFSGLEITLSGNARMRNETSR